MKQLWLAIGNARSALDFANKADLTPQEESLINAIRYTLDAIECLDLKLSGCVKR